jgi:serine/threonine-protein kinase
MIALPEIIGAKYRVTGQVGKGGMATVYSAVHLGTDSRVAVKVMTTVEKQVDIDAEVSSLGAAGQLERFEREARVAGNIETQHVTRVFDTGLDPALGPYIVMELLTGDDVKELVHRLGPLRPDLALRIVGQACIGLARAHATGIIHRDVKASNLFVAETEFDSRIVKLLDFGIAKGRLNDRVDAGDAKTLTKTGAMLGSPHYMSPEQVLGKKEIDHRSDIWSLGVVLYKCLSARTPFDDRDTVGQLILSIVQGTPPSVQDFAPWVPPEVAEIVARALKQHPSERFQTADEMSEAIRAILPERKLEIVPAMLSPMTDDERRDVKPRVSMSIELAPDAAKRPRRPSQLEGDTLRNGPKLGESDTTISPATASLRRPAIRHSSPWSRIGVAGLALAGVGALVWGLAHRSSTLPQPAAAATLETSQPSDPAPASPASAPAPQPDTVGWHVEVRVVPATATVEVDGAPATVEHGAVDLTGALGSVHKVHVRAGGRETTAEVIVADDGARPHVVALPDPRVTAASPARKTSAPPAAQPAAVKTAARFDTKFE